MKKEGKRLPRKEKKRIKKDGAFLVSLILLYQTRPKKPLNIYAANRQMEQWSGVPTNGWGFPIKL